MKKQLGMASLISLTLALSACGGSGEGSATTNHPVASTNNILFDNKDTFYSYKLGIDEATTEKNTFTRKNDILYLKTNHAATAKQYGSYFLTETELYQPETPATVNSAQGIRDSFIKSATDEELVSIPYNPQGYKGLEITTKSKVMDLKGKLIAPILAPSDAAFVGFYQNNPDYRDLKLSLVSKMLAANDVFPDGAKCRQPVSTEYSKSMLEFQPNDETQVIANVRNLQEWANQNFDDGISASALVTRYNWAGYNWGAIQLKNYDAQGRVQYMFAIEYQGKIYHAQFASGKLLFSDLLTAYQQYQLAQGVNQFLIANIITNLKTSCLTYNDVAAKAIDEAVDKAKAKTINIDPEANDSAAPPSQEVIDAAKDALGTSGTIDVPLDLANQPGTSSCYGALSFC